MRKVEKDLSIIPLPLYDTTTKEGRKTERKRRILMSSRSRYKNSYDECYKWNDIQDMLASIYKNKCVYCEEKITRINAKNLSGKEEISHAVEHYRPKSKYHWLAFSWDNLLWCCKKCTDIKDNNFEVLNEKIEYEDSFKENIHSSNQLYNLQENPKMIHPELEDVSNKLIFDRKGNIDSTDDRVKYTITTCGLDRRHLNTERKKIMDDFLNKISDTISQNNTQLREIVIREFKENSKNMNNEFIAFRLFILHMMRNI